MRKILCTLLITLLGVVLSKNTHYLLDERWVCNIKTTCFDCLKLPHCTWCQAERSCFSQKVPTFEDYCMDNKTVSQDFGFSFAENAQCTCAGDQLEQHCYPPGVTQEAECSGRGKCICGRCVCNPNPDPEHPTKTVMGEFCEYDNFSCNGSRCNEGPYSIKEPRTSYENGLDDV